MTLAPPAAAGVRTRQPQITDFRLVLLIVGVAVAARAITFGNPIVHVDEEFYFTVAHEWLRGAVPYLDIWDRKPIGLFALYRPAAALGYPAGIWAYQALALTAVVATAWIVARLARDAGWGSAALLAAVAYILWLDLAEGEGGQSPVFYNLPMAGAAWLILGDRAARPTRALAAMLLVGVAMQIKYSVVFEGLFFGLWTLWRHWRNAPASHRDRIAGRGNGRSRFAADPLRRVGLCRDRAFRHVLVREFCVHSRSQQRFAAGSAWQSGAPRRDAVAAGSHGGRRVSRFANDGHGQRADIPVRVAGRGDRRRDPRRRLVRSLCAAGDPARRDLRGRGGRVAGRGPARGDSRCCWRSRSVGRRYWSPSGWSAVRPHSSLGLPRWSARGRAVCSSIRARRCSIPRPGGVACRATSSPAIYRAIARLGRRGSIRRAKSDASSLRTRR